jgi:L-lysine epsilon oxidase-like protein
MSNYTFRVHPSIGIARVGNSEKYYLAPETMAALPAPGSQEANKQVSGGLPIKASTESDHIRSSDLRDENGALLRQAARFRIFRYEAPRNGAEKYPHGGGTEVKIGDTVDGKEVTDIVWTVHVANKKANWYVLEWPPSGLSSLMGNYDRGLPPELPPRPPGALPTPRPLPLRNKALGDPSDPSRRRKLIIDPGPRTILGSSRGKETVNFNATTSASIYNKSYNNGEGKELIEPLDQYPKSFPRDNFSRLYSPTGDIDTLGQLETDGSGRLLVVAAYGRACAWYGEDDEPYPLANDVDNDGWFDDTADGPVSAVVVLKDATTGQVNTEEVHGGWVVTTDPGYAPQTPNVVTLWDDVFDVWVRQLDLMPELFHIGYKENFFPTFEEHIYPIFRTAAMQKWNAFLPPYAIKAHDAVGDITATDNPSATILGGLGYIRNPNNPAESNIGVPLMPLSLGDAGEPFLSLTYTQYFFLSQWNAERYITHEQLRHGRSQQVTPLGSGEYLDKASLFNCLGGRFGPGIEMTFIVRDPQLWVKNWRTSGGGPFRVKAKQLDYTQARADQPFLTQGYVPVHTGDTGLEPGDTSKFMSLPWHTDYNSCATHPIWPNQNNNTTIFWSWPAQRPVSVYVAAEVNKKSDQLAAQQYSVRGPGTASLDAAQQGRFANRLDIITQWTKIGVIIQGSAIDNTDGGPYSAEHFLEVKSQLHAATGEPPVQPWPSNVART